MQRAQRKLHLFLWLLIAPVILIVIALSLGNRPEFPIEPIEPPAQGELR